MRLRILGEPSGRVWRVLLDSQVRGAGGGEPQPDWNMVGGRGGVLSWYGRLVVIVEEALEIDSFVVGKVGNEGDGVKNGIFSRVV